MTLADRLQTPPPRNTGGLPCSIGAVLDQLTDDERKVFEAALTNPDWPDTAIYDALTAEGFTRVAPTSVKHHRRKRCRCFR